MGLTWFIHFNFSDETRPGIHDETTHIVVEDRDIDHSYSYLKSNDDNPTVVLFPDHLHDKYFLMPLAESLYSLGYNALIIHYPTADRQGNNLSHSTDSRAQFSATLMDSLSLNQVHLAGQGYGGLVVSSFTSSKYNVNVKSVALLASYGVEELHFLGNETINRTLYSLLYPAVFTFKYLTPHLGWYHHQKFNYKYVRSQRSMNQRAVRDWMLAIEEPVLILQPTEDRYISSAISEENHRLLPQSYYVSVTGDHQAINESPDRFSEQMDWFFSMAEDGELVHRESAEENRIDNSIQPFDPDNIETQSNWTLLVIILLLAVISLVSEDLACIGGGLLVASGVINFWIAVLGASIGIVSADILIYLLGRWIGKPILYKIPFRWIIKPDDVKKAEQMFEMYGVGIIFAARFLPGTRFPTYLVAGILRARFLFFTGYFLLSLVIWAPLIIVITVLIGHPMIEYVQAYQNFAWLFVIVILALIYLIIKIIIPLTTVKGRRQLMVKLNRFRDRWIHSEEQ